MPHDKNRALEVIEFLQMLKLVDDFHGQPFVLQKWQHDILWEVYGTVNDDGYRQYRYAYLEIPKKNAKTTTIAGLAVYHLTCDPPDGQIYCCAADRGQAELIYKAAVGMIDQDPELQKILKVTDSKKEIKNKLTNTRLKVLSAEAYTKHGLNPTVVIFDELHAQPNRNLWDVMTFGAGAARKEPLWWVITTAGDDPDRHSIGWEIHEKARKIQDGESVNPAWYVKIYGAPEDADIFDEKTWYLANPSLGVTIDINAVRLEAIDAKESESAERLFRWLRLNQWISTKQIGWLPVTLWDSTQGKWEVSELIGKKCYTGLDLSSTTDITAQAHLFPPQEGIPDWRVIFEGWVPENKMRERQEKDGVPYEAWVNKGYLNSTPGDVIDYDFVEAAIVKASKQYKMKMLLPDPWNFNILHQRLEKNEAGNFTIDPKRKDLTVVVGVDQIMKELSPSMKEIERLLKKGELTHNYNPVARWCFGNIILDMDGNENIKASKKKSKDRIDLIAALINAMSQAIKQEKISVYEKRGMRSLL
jgi:phage terminase large subunit-like protein